MSESKHTPSPWMIEDRTEAGAGYSIVSETAHYSVAGVAHYISHRDARLIAAAPDMLDLLKWLDSRGRLGLDVHEKIAAAISKAEGRS